MIYGSPIEDYEPLDLKYFCCLCGWEGFETELHQCPQCRRDAHSKDEIVHMLEWLSSPAAEGIEEQKRLTLFCKYSTLALRLVETDDEQDPS